jgi:hypothetical protein
MAALTTRKAARERLMKVFVAELERLLPADDAGPEAWQTFREWEEQADKFDRTVTAVLIEELAALQVSAQVQDGGRCPHCGSDRVYLEPRAAKQTELQTNHGVVVVGRQRCRCRACHRSFSPSGPRLESAPGGDGPLAARGQEIGAGGHDAQLRSGGAGAQ